MKKLFLIITSLFYFISIFSCNAGNFCDFLYRTDEDPFLDAPTAQSFIKENSVQLSWAIDEAADEYILLKSEDKKNPQFECIYRGTKPAFTDTCATNEKRFLYRLDKIRGQKRFYGTETVFGICSTIKQDAFEPNNSPNEAKELTHDATCSLLNVKYEYDGTEVIDSDWFFVRIPPLRTAELIVSQKNMEAIFTGAKTELLFQEQGSDSVPIKQLCGIRLTNPGYTEKYARFRIFPDRDFLFEDQSHFSLLEYTVSLNKIYIYEF